MDLAEGGSHEGLCPSLAKTQGEEMLSEGCRVLLSPEKFSSIVKHI